MLLVERLHEELKAVRKTRDGLSVGTLAQQPALCAALGDGNPAVAYNALKHALLATDVDLELAAAMASLGFTSDRRTHLGRLEDFGVEFNYDQRQARRYSDSGLLRMALLIATQWSTISVPRLDVTITPTSPSSFAFMIRSWQQHYIEMRPLMATLHEGDKEQPVVLQPEEDVSDQYWLRQRYPLVEIRVVQPESSVALTWTGETWPKFSVELIGSLDDHASLSESLGDELLVRLRSLT